jgi:hypothetical protein
MTRDEAIELVVKALEAGAEAFTTGVDYAEVGARIDRALGSSEMGSRATFVRWREVAAALRSPDADGWIPWAGGECPVPTGTAGEARLRSGASPHRWDMTAFQWHHAGVPADIVAYRITKPAPAPAKPEPDAFGWIPWTGGECPAPGVPGEARLRSGNITRRDDLSSLRWAHAGVPGDIVAYRIAAPAPKPEFVPGFRPAAPRLPEAPEGISWALVVTIDDTDATLTREPHPCDGETAGYRLQIPEDRSMPAVDLWLGADDVGRLVAALRLLGAPA